MNTPEAENNFVRAAELLQELQEQLIRYKSALDSIDRVGEATEQAAGQLEAIARGFQQLQQVQTALVKEYNDTRKALSYSQKQIAGLSGEIQNLQKSIRQLEEMSRQHAEKVASISPGLAGTGATLRQVTWFMLGQTAIIFVLFFSLFIYFSPSSPPQQKAQPLSVRKNQPARTPPEKVQDSAPVKQKQAAKPLEVQILNGCGVPGVAQAVKAFLAESKIPVKATGNADRFDYPRSIIYTRNPNDARAAEIGSLMGISPSRILPAPQRWAKTDLTIVIGKDYNDLSPFRSPRP